MNNQRLTVSISIALLTLSAPLRADEKKGHFFGTLDYYLAGDIGDDLEDMNHSIAEFSTRDGDPARSDTDTSGGIGGRIGYLRNVGPNFALGGSLGYVAGPTIDSKVTFLPGGVSGTQGYLSEKIKSKYIRFMAEGVGRIPLNEKATVNMGLGLGFADAKTNQEFAIAETDGVTTQSASGKSDEHIMGFTWELSPSVDIHLGKTDLSLGLRYSMFPKIKKTDETLEVDWTALGFFAGMKF